VAAPGSTGSSAQVEVTLDLDEARAFLAGNHRAVMSTRRRDGSPQMSTVLVGLDGDGRAVVSTRETAMKTLNVRRDPRVWLCVMNDAFFGRWIQVGGTAEVLSLPEAMEPLVDYYRGISGEHPDWDDYRRAMEGDRRVLIRVTLTAAGPDRSG
jgi:PPOX class probable F420-dependent enzyme